MRTPRVLLHDIFIFPPFILSESSWLFKKKHSPHTQRTVKHNTLQDRVLSSYEGSCRRQLRYHQLHNFSFGDSRDSEIFFTLKSSSNVALGRVFSSHYDVGAMVAGLPSKGALLFIIIKTVTVL